jgi:hypothetical protein
VQQDAAGAARIGQPQAAATAADVNAKNTLVSSKANAKAAPTVAVSAGVSVKTASAQPAPARHPGDADNASPIATLSISPTLSQGWNAQAVRLSVCLWAKLQVTRPNRGASRRFCSRCLTRQAVRRQTHPKPKVTMLHTAQLRI